MCVRETFECVEMTFSSSLSLKKSQTFVHEWCFEIVTEMSVAVLPLRTPRDICSRSILQGGTLCAILNVPVLQYIFLRVTSRSKSFLGASTMMQPSSPSAAVAAAISAHRGKRTGIELAEKGAIPVKDGIEDMNEFWDAAKTPDQKVFVEKKKKALKPQNASARAEVPKQKPRFSLPGQVQDEDDNEKATNKARKILSRVNKIKKEPQLEWSPSELSRVSTAPPTPASVVTQQNEDETPYSPPVAQHEEDETPLSPPEEVRASPSEEHQEAVVPQTGNSPTVGTLPTTTDEPEDNNFPVDDDDDMVPPPPPEEEDADLSLPPEDAQKDDVEFPDADDYDDDGDKEGGGYAVVHDPETPESVHTERFHQEKERERKKKAKRKKKDVASVAETTVQSIKPKRPKKKVTYSSPMGYPAGNREYEFVPVSDFKESPKDDNVRRSRRARTKPLAFWKNERPLYEAHNETGILGEAMGNMPVVTAFIAAQPTPYKKRKVTAVASKSNKKVKKGKQAVGVVEVEDTPFDSKKLRKKYRYIDGEEAEVWDEVADDTTHQKVVSYAENMVATSLPLPASRKKSEGRVVGKAAQAFNVPTDDDDMYVGYIMGSLVLPPSGIKDAESSGSCSLSFTICQAQPKSVEVAFADPNDGEGDLNVKTAQRFLLGPGDMFRVLPGNCYRLQNHSETTECLVSWTIIRPRLSATEE